MEDLQGAEETERRAKEKAIKSAAAEAAAEKRRATQARVERMKDWDDEEVRMLEKALEKFPQVGAPLPAQLCCLSKCGQSVPVSWCALPSTKVSCAKGLRTCYSQIYSSTGATCSHTAC